MILTGRTSHPIACDGLLVIGDPHIGLAPPGSSHRRRLAGSILAKLERCVSIANDRDLVPVILGDLFDRPVEPDVALKSQLIRMLQGFRRRAIVNVGNHDMAHTTLSDGDSLALLGLCDVVDVVASSGPVASIEMKTHRLGLGMTPYGQAIPQDVSGSFAQADRLAWFTHHDIAFDASYPGAVPPHAIAGCDLSSTGTSTRRKNRSGGAHALAQPGQHLASIGRSRGSRAAGLDSRRERRASSGSPAVRNRCVRSYGTPA